MSDDILYILDSYGLIYRSYFAFVGRPLTNKEGQNVSAVFGFFRNLNSLINEYHPQRMAAAFDSRVPTFRHDLYADYKATRQKTPEDLHAQVPVVEEILSTLGIPTIRCDGFEADDLIATLAESTARSGQRCRILSADKDLMQLVGEYTDMLKPDKNGGWTLVDAAGVEAEWGVPPEKMLDLLSLTGDTADNVPGVAGIGVKTAAKLLHEYGSIDSVYEHADSIKGAIGAKIRAGRESAFFSRELISLRRDVPIDMHIVPFAQAADYHAAAELLNKHGLPSIAKLFSHSESASEHTPQPEAEAENRPLVKNQGSYRAILSEQELSSYIDSLLSAREQSAAFDCETDSLDSLHARLAGFSLSNKSGEGVYIPLIHPDPLNAPPIDTQAALAQLERIFGNSAFTVIMHNGKFDYEVLVSQGLKPPVCRLADTMIAAWLLEPDRSSYGLEQLAQARLSLETTAFSDLVPKDRSFVDVPLEDAVNYAAEDADLTWQLWKIYETELDRNKLTSLFYELEMPVMPLLARMEAAGIHIEKEELAAYAQELSAKITATEAEIHEMVGHPFNIASTKQLQEVLFSELKLPTGKKTKTGYSTDTAVLEELRALHPVPAKILEYRMRSKLLSTYVDALPALADSEGRVHTSFMQTGTATGRLSSRDPNLQNIPVRDEEGRRIRSAFTAAAGYTLISADYSQIELVLLAHLSGDEALCAAFNAGVDVHRATAARVFGVDAEAVSPEQRRAAKVINFGVMYGMSAFRLSNELGIPRAEAADFINQYFATYSGVRAFIDETIKHAEAQGFVETLFGRRRHIRGITSRNKMEKAGAERIAVNTPIQGSAADIVKKAMLAADELLAREFPSGRLLLQVHDELIIECAEAQADQASAALKTCMEQVVSLRVPLKVHVEQGKRWGEFH